MRLYEFQAAGLEQDLEGQLKNVSDGIDADQNQPDPAGGMEPPSDEPDVKPIDSGLMASTKGLPYATEYSFEDDSKLNPVVIMGMAVGELQNLRNLVRTKINMKTVSDEYGLYDNPEMKFYQDLLTFVERTMSYRKQHDQSGDSESPAPPKVQAQGKPKNQVAGAWK